MADYQWTDIDTPEFEERLAELYQDVGSIRGLSRTTGIPYTTLQNIISGTTRRASEQTRSRLESYFEALPDIVRQRAFTVAVDREMWTASQLANLEPPAGARFWQAVYHSTATPSGLASTGYVALDTRHPADLLLEPGFDPRAVTRVIWAGGHRG